MGKITKTTQLAAGPSASIVPIFPDLYDHKAMALLRSLTLNPTRTETCQAVRRCSSDIGRNAVGFAPTGKNLEMRLSATNGQPIRAGDTGLPVACNPFRVGRLW